MPTSEPELESETTPTIEPFPLHRPRFQVAPLVETREKFEEALQELSRGSGALAVDAERASGFRYFSHAYLFQFYRRGSRIFLIDPVPLRDAVDLIESFNQQFAKEEWIIHASTQDLPCIRQFGFTPRRIFDTELGARLAGLPRVGLGPLTEELLALSLAKEHSAVDWSYRPLHPEWKNYAALDVDVLPDLRDALTQIIEGQGKMELVMEEFQSILEAAEPGPRPEPWRRTSGIHHVKGRRGLAIVRELWLERDHVAQQRDIAPGRLFPDFAISDIAIAARNLSPQQFSDNVSELFHASQHFQRHYRKFGRELIPQWKAAVVRALSIAEADLPLMRAASDALPPVKLWRDRAPLAYARLTHARFNLGERAEMINMPMENLLAPELVRRMAWLSEKEPARFHATTSQEVGDISIEVLSAEIRGLLAKMGARHWQIDQVTEPLALALREREPRVVEESDSPSQE